MTKRTTPDAKKIRRPQTFKRCGRTPRPSICSSLLCIALLVWIGPTLASTFRVSDDFSGPGSGVGWEAGDTWDGAVSDGVAMVDGTTVFRALSERVDTDNVDRLVLSFDMARTNDRFAGVSLYDGDSELIFAGRPFEADGFGVTVLGRTTEFGGPAVDTNFHRVVMEIDFGAGTLGNDLIRLFVDDGSIDDPDVVIDIANVFGSFSQIRIASDGMLTVDDLTLLVDRRGDSRVDLEAPGGSFRILTLGGEPGNQLGRSAAGAGDVNGDGLDDVIVGGDDRLGFDGPGAAHVVFGTADLPRSPLLVSSLNGRTGFSISGSAAGAAAGFSVGGAGDVNDDDLDDVIVGAPRANPVEGGSTGEAYVVFGSQNDFPANMSPASLNGENGLVLVGADAGDFCGSAVGFTDFDGDMVDDLFIGASDAARGDEEFVGETYVVFGDEAGLPSSVALSGIAGAGGLLLQGFQPEGFTAYVVGNAGDVNGDGIGDLIISADSASPGGRQFAGEAYVVFGAPGPLPGIISLDSLDGTNGFTLRGIAAGDTTGASVAGAGDLNGDGLDDVVVGASRAAPAGLEDVGRTYVVFGSRQPFPAIVQPGALNGVNGFVLEGIGSGDNAGWSVGGAGDFDGDGFDDLLIGAPSAAPYGRNNAGEVYLVYGSDRPFTPTLPLADLDRSSGVVLVGGGAGDQAGYAVAGAGDFDGDGLADILVTALRAEGGAGRAYLVFGKARPLFADGFES